MEIAELNIWVADLAIAVAVRRIGAVSVADVVRSGCDLSFRVGIAGYVRFLTSMCEVWNYAIDADGRPMSRTQVLLLL